MTPSRTTRLLILSLLCSSSGAAADIVTFGVKRWITVGRDLYTVSAPQPAAAISPGSTLYYGQTFEFNRADASMNLYSMEVRPWKYLSADIQYAAAALRSGHSVQHDFLDAEGAVVTVSPSLTNFISPDHQDYGRQESQLNGRTQWLTASLYVRVFSVQGEAQNFLNYDQNLDLLVGYDRYAERFRMTNSYQTLSTVAVAPEPALGQVPGQNSTFDFQWQGARFGVRETLTTNFGLSLKALIAYSPLQLYRGSGFQNLSATLRKTPPNFRQYGDGSILDWSLGLEYAATSFISIDAGWDFLSLWTRNGRESDFLLNGLVDTRRLETARSQRMGWYAGASLRF